MYEFYLKEKAKLLRLMTIKNGAFSSEDFDRWFKGREFKRPIPIKPIEGDQPLLGLAVNGFNMWAEYLELLQWLVSAGYVATGSYDYGEKLGYIITDKGREWLKSYKYYSGSRWSAKELRQFFIQEVPKIILKRPLSTGMK